MPHKTTAYMPISLSHKLLCFTSKDLELRYDSISITSTVKEMLLPKFGTS
jgi:hypothetical protein